MSTIRKFFVSYKYKDPDVYNKFVSKYKPGEDTDYLYTPKHYVDRIIDIIGEEHVYKGEKGDESMAHLADDTIDSKLKEKIFDSSVTVVLISPNMWDKTKHENEQWIPNEIMYSLRDGKKRGDRVSNANGILAVALPDSRGSYDYAVAHRDCGVRSWQTHSFFYLIRENMFNRNKPNHLFCKHCLGHHHFGDDHSYAHPVKWEDFIKNYNDYLEHAIKLRDSIHEFKVVKTHNN